MSAYPAQEFMELVDLASKIAFHHEETREELETVLRANGGRFFQVYDNVMFTVNEYDIIMGVGMHCESGIKIWDNTQFGTFKK